jgi:hypothetical protein
MIRDAGSARDGGGAPVRLREALIGGGRSLRKCFQATPSDSTMLVKMTMEKCSSDHEKMIIPRIDLNALATYKVGAAWDT